MKTAHLIVLARLAVAAPGAACFILALARQVKLLNDCVATPTVIEYGVVPYFFAMS
jgi:hypothetical protein